MFRDEVSPPCAMFKGHTGSLCIANASNVNATNGIPKCKISFAGTIDRSVKFDTVVKDSTSLKALKLLILNA